MGKGGTKMEVGVRYECEWQMKTNFFFLMKMEDWNQLFPSFWYYGNTVGVVPNEF